MKSRNESGQSVHPTVKKVRLVVEGIRGRRQELPAELLPRFVNISELKTGDIIEDGQDKYWVALPAENGVLDVKPVLGPITRMELGSYMQLNGVQKVKLLKRKV